MPVWGLALGQYMQFRKASFHSRLVSSLEGFSVSIFIRASQTTPCMDARSPSASDRGRPPIHEVRRCLSVPNDSQKPARPPDQSPGGWPANVRCHRAPASDISCWQSLGGPPTAVGARVLIRPAQRFTGCWLRASTPWLSHRQAQFQPRR